MGLLKIIKKTKQKEKELRVLILGLDNAGKTTIVSSKSFWERTLQKSLQRWDSKSRLLSTQVSSLTFGMSEVKPRSDLTGAIILSKPMR